MMFMTGLDIEAPGNRYSVNKYYTARKDEIRCRWIIPEKGKT